MKIAKPCCGSCENAGRGYIKHERYYYCKKTGEDIDILAGLCEENYKPRDPIETWISVKDKLPEYRIPVLTITDCGGMDVCYLSGSKYWCNSIRPQHTNGGVTHWQPLPDPPEGK